MKLFLMSILFISAVFSKDDGSVLYHSCKFCHGYQAEIKYMNMIPTLKNMSAEEIKLKLELYKKGELDVYGFGSLMQMQMKNIPLEKIPELSTYIEQL